MERIEIEEAIGEVARRHNILLSPDDPLLVTVTLNEVILRRLIARQNQALEAAQDQIAAGAAQQIETARQLAGLIITGASEFVAGELRSATAALQADLLAAAQRERNQAALAVASARHARRQAWVAAAVTAALLNLCLGVIIGSRLDLSPDLPPPAPRAARLQPAPSVSPP